MNTATAEQPTPRENILRVASELGLEMEADFIPFSQSRNKAEKYPSLNWIVKLYRGRSKRAAPYLTTDYSAGCGHAPSYKQSDRSVDRDKLVRWECENGYRGHSLDSWHVMRANKTPLKPDMADVLYSLTMDSDVLEHSSFEEWAQSFGYDVDSRKAESVYRFCLEIALKLRNAIGEDGLAKLREACQDY